MIDQYLTITEADTNGLLYEEWYSVSEEHIPSKADIGKRIWVAGDSITARKFLAKVHLKGDKWWPHSSGYTVRARNGWTQAIVTESCRLHPTEYRKIKLSKEESA